MQRSEAKASVTKQMLVLSPMLSHDSTSKPVSRKNWKLNMTSGSFCSRGRVDEDFNAFLNGTPVQTAGATY